MPGVDVAPTAIAAARDKDRERSPAAEFLVFDATRIGGLERTFAPVGDSGLFHVAEGGAPADQAAGLATVLRPGGRCHVHGSSSLEPGPGPRPLTRAALHDAFDGPPYCRVAIGAAAAP